MGSRQIRNRPYRRRGRTTRRRPLMKRRWYASAAAFRIARLPQQAYGPLPRPSKKTRPFTTAAVREEVVSGGGPPPPASTVGLRRRFCPSRKWALAAGAPGRIASWRAIRRTRRLGRHNATPGGRNGGGPGELRVRGRPPRRPPGLLRGDSFRAIRDRRGWRQVRTQCWRPLYFDTRRSRFAWRRAFRPLLLGISADKRRSTMEWTGAPPSADPMLPKGAATALAVGGGPVASAANSRRDLGRVGGTPRPRPWSTRSRGRVGRGQTAGRYD